MANSLATVHKEAIAEQLVRLVRLIPSIPGGVLLDLSDPQGSIAAMLSEQKRQIVYFKVFDTAFSLLDTGNYGLSQNERLSAAVDIVELVRNKIEGNE